MDQTQQTLEQEIARLEQQLREVVAAEQVFESAPGKLIVELIGKRVTLSTRKITSNEFIKDHEGYVNELSWLNANKRLLRELQVAAAPARARKIRERLEDHERRQF